MQNRISTPTEATGQAAAPQTEQQAQADHRTEDRSQASPEPPPAETATAPETALSPEDVEAAILQTEQMLTDLDAHIAITLAQKIASHEHSLYDKEIGNRILSRCRVDAMLARDVPENLRKIQGFMCALASLRA